MYPRSNGLFLFLPQRQTIVLLTDNTIRELCSRTTPTSQFSSLHFIASTAIGAKSIERLAENTARLGGKAPTWGVRRVLAQTAGQAGCADTLVSAWYRHLAHTMGGDWTHLSRYLIAMLWGLDLVQKALCINYCLHCV